MISMLISVRQILWELVINLAVNSIKYLSLTLINAPCHFSALLYEHKTLKPNATATWCRH